MARVILVVIVLVLVVLFIGTSAFIGLQVFEGSTQLVTNEKTTGLSNSLWEDYDFDFESFITKYKIEGLKIGSSFEEHIIPADYIYAIDSQNSKNNKTVIMAHGLGGNRYSNYPIAELFLEQGYNVITYDQRSSNENTAKYTTFGYFEKYDLIDCVKYVEEQAPGQKIGLWGASFGGATAGQAVGYHDVGERVDFLILDSPVSSMYWMLNEEMKSIDISIPASYMTWCGSIINKLKLGFTYKDADVPTALKDVNIPVLIINSKMDLLTPYFMGKNIYDAVPGSNKEIWTVEDSKHYEIWLDYNQEYRDRVASFLSRYE
mgnify:FL=1